MHVLAKPLLIHNIYIYLKIKGTNLIRLVKILFIYTVIDELESLLNLYLF